MNEPEAKFLEDYTDKAGFEQSKLYGHLAAVTSTLSSSSGIHMVPFINYSSNIQNRYMLGAGHQISMPGLGKWWMGNPSVYPWGVKRTLRHLSQYLANNPDEHPRELPALVHAVVGKIFPQLSLNDQASHERTLIEMIYHKRDPFLVQGKIPQEKRTELGEVMKNMLTGAGLEQTLLQAGLNPAEADIAHNGMSGKLANMLGHGTKVESLRREYRDSFAQRLKNTKPMPDNPENKGTKPIAQSTSFQERLKSGHAHEALTHL
jgi:hypothetical protein